MLPSWSSYASSSNINALRFDIGGYTFWYSYKALIAFRAPGHPLIVSENQWTATTGKHLNLIDGNKKNRVDAATFKRLQFELIEPRFREAS
jgi:hypothetical protein